MNIASVTASIERSVPVRDRLTRDQLVQSFGLFPGRDEAASARIARFLIYGDLDGFKSVGPSSLPCVSITYQDDAPFGPVDTADILCSHGPHFPLIIPNGYEYVLLNEGKYSATTSRHQRIARQTLRSLGFVPAESNKGWEIRDTMNAHTAHLASAWKLPASVRV